MIHLLLAIICGSLFAILFKLFQRVGINASPVILMSYLVSAYIAFCIMLRNGEPQLDRNTFTLPAIITGGFMAGSFYAMNQATLSHGVAVATISARMSFIIPVIGSFLLFHSDQPQWGIVALIALSLILIFFRRDNNVRDNSTDSNIRKSRDWLNPLLVFLCYGISNLLLKHLQNTAAEMGGSNTELQSLTLFTFLGAFIFSLFFTLKELEGKPAPDISWKDYTAAVILGAANVGCVYFLMKSLTVIDSSVFYPVYNIAIVVIATLVGRLCFGEKLSSLQWAGIILAIVAILLFFR